MKIRPLLASGPLVLATLLLGSGCKKEVDPSEEVGPVEIFGDWQWVSDVGGPTGKVVHTPSTDGFQRTYQFNRDSTFVECFDNQCEAPVKFKLRMEKSFFDGKQHLIVTIPRRLRLAPPDTSSVVLIFRYTVSGTRNTLSLAHEVADSYEESYKRK